MARAWVALLAAIWLALLPVAQAADEVPLPALTARVTDLTGTLAATDKQRLEILLEGVERDRSAQIAVLLLPTTKPETIEQFGIRLAEAWKVGHKGKDDGVIVIVAKDDRKMRIEVGYGLEGAIPDAVAKRIIAERMGPRFKQGDFAGGLVDAVEEMERAIAAGNPAATDSTGAASSPTGGGDAFGGESPDRFPWLFGVIIVAGLLRMIFGFLGSVAVAAAGGWLGWLVFGSLPIAIGAAVLAFLMSFVNLFSGGRGGGWSSGGGGSFSSGDSFSGGGGSFGGGGASGDW